MDFKLIKSGLAALGVLVSVSGAQAAVDKDAIAERLAPVGEVCLASQDCGSASAAPAASSSDDGGGADGEGIYGQVCSVCHDSGVAGAPVRGDEDQWAARVDKGFDTLLDHAINGFNGMPAKGGNPGLSDDDMHAAVAYMVEPVMDVPDAEGAPAKDATEESAEDSAEDSAKENSASADAATQEDTAAADDASAEEAGDQAQAEDTAGGESAWASIDGKAVFDKACMACHATGAAGAPVVGNAEQWASHIEKGKDTLYDHAINGFNAMPAKGGQAGLSDDEVKASVDYMVEESQ
ncbi:c-type cytochrome [Vreelandella subglaciescola]|uniref:Cytochrome c5 n=1 Tax=Vreelandella subglaciescola TaxID=29571 RepID=A0A1M7H5D8_9GAMM|nr:c-type cytochrome [Halomonas subglaciescola]SHM23781.1 Cytochrome c5 [Halomonas subglaciescola]